MPKSLAEILASQAKTQLQLCIDRGLPASFTASDVDDILSAPVDDNEKINTLTRYIKMAHEVLYAPPPRG